MNISAVSSSTDILLPRTESGNIAIRTVYEKQEAYFKRMDHSSTPMVVPGIGHAGNCLSGIYNVEKQRGRF